MNDPLSRALHEAPEAHEPGTPDEVASYRTDRAPPLGTVLGGLRAQLVEAMALPFFDAGADVETTPVTKHALSEAGATTIVARKRAPAYEAKVSIEVRSDHDVPSDTTETGRYQVKARAHLRCDDARGRTERAVGVTVREISGTLRLDVPMLRTELAAAIHAIGKASPDAP